MPELPEVEVMAQCVRKWTEGRSLQLVRAVDARLAGGMPPGWAARRGTFLAPEDSRVSWVGRRGKTLLIRLKGLRGCWAWHFRMTGKVAKTSADEDWADRRFVRLVLGLDDGTNLLFVDRRCLGTVEWIDDWSAWEAQGTLGPEFWMVHPGDSPFHRNGGWWAQQMAGKRSCIKPALMDQKRVSGLGNIAASEICWRARINPWTPVMELCHTQWAAVALAAEAYVADTIRAEHGGEIHFVGDGGTNPFHVYDREGQACPHCAGLITRGVQAGRGTFFCENCQPLPDLGPTGSDSDKQ